jgi:hypothetical protein
LGLWWFRALGFRVFYGERVYDILDVRVYYLELKRD